MKTKFLLLGMFLSILTFSSCTTDSNSATTDVALTSQEVAATQKMDNSIDDISVIADNQYELSEGSATGRVSTGYYSLLPECATVSDLGSTNTVRVLTITFGTATSSCKFRGHNLKGQIILTRTIGTAFPKIMTITYNNFHINDNKIDGTTSWKREMIGDGMTLHPKTTLTMTNMTLTTKDGVYVRNGYRIREMIAGFLTRNSPTDDIFSTYGTFTTTKGENVFTSLINAETPLINKTACGLLAIPMPFPVSGILKLSRNSHFVTIDYGNGECDNLAMKSVDGGVPVQITLED
jgi:hypothetical protein